LGGLRAHGHDNCIAAERSKLTFKPLVAEPLRLGDLARLLQQPLGARSVPRESKTDAFPFCVLLPRRPRLKASVSFLAKMQNIPVRAWPLPAHRKGEGRRGNYGLLNGEPHDASRRWTRITVIECHRRATRRSQSNSCPRCRLRKNLASHVAPSAGEYSTLRPSAPSRPSPEQKKKAA
jgi:hypothetical protein